MMLIIVRKDVVVNEDERLLNISLVTLCKVDVKFMCLPTKVRQSNI